MTPTAPADSSALAPLVDRLLAGPLTELSIAELQQLLTTVMPQVARLQGWLTAAEPRATALYTSLIARDRRHNNELDQLLAWSDRPDRPEVVVLRPLGLLAVHGRAVGGPCGRLPGRSAGATPRASTRMDHDRSTGR